MDDDAFWQGAHRVLAAGVVEKPPLTAAQRRRIEERAAAVRARRLKVCADRAAARVPLAASAPLLVKELTPADNLMAVAAYIEKENEAPSPAAAPTVAA